MMFKRIALAAALLFALTSAAAAQCTGTFAANTFCGSLTGGPPGPRAITSGVINMAAGTVLGNATTAAALATDLRAPVLGLNGTAQGSIGLRGSTSGVVTIQPGGAAAGTFNFNLPTTAGTAGFALLSGGGGSTPQSYAILGLAAGGTNAALTASNGGLVYSTGSELAILAGTATAGQIPRSGASAAPSWSTATYPATATQGSILAAVTANVISATPTPVLGIPGTTIGTLGFAGSGSGTATITPQAAAGTPSLVLPNTSGTFAVGASSPLVLSATTGGLTCPTCVTSSGGGAITGTAPVAVSAAGVVSITGVAGQVLAGSGPAFTATPTLGVAGSVVGTLAFANATSGSITISPVTGALGARTINLPAASGTFAVSASGALSLSATGDVTVNTNGITDTLFRQGGALSVVGRSANSTGNVADISAGTDGHVLRRASSVLGFGTIDLGFVNTVGSSVLLLANGGSSKALTASNGGLIYSDGDSMEVLAGTATAGQIPRSGSSSAPSWSTATYPATTAAGTVQASATANTVAATATPVLGIAGSVLGSLTLSGNTSGTLLIRPAAAAGSWTLTLPGDDGNSGEVLSTNGSGTTSWIAAGGTGTVTSAQIIGAGLAVNSGTCTITTTGACTITVTAASASDQETGTSTTVAVVPNVQQRHPSAAKAWVFCSSGGTVNAGYNATTCTNTGTGTYTLTFTTAMSSTNYACVFSSNASGQASYLTAITLGTTTVDLVNRATDGGALLNAAWSAVCYGDQ